MDDEYMISDKEDHKRWLNDFLNVKTQEQIIRFFNMIYEEGIEQGERNVMDDPSTYFGKDM